MTKMVCECFSEFTCTLFFFSISDPVPWPVKSLPEFSYLQEQFERCLMASENSTFPWSFIYMQTILFSFFGNVCVKWHSEKLIFV